MIRGMAGMTPTMGPAPDPSRTGDILIVKGQPSGCPFCLPCFPAGSTAPGVGPLSRAAPPRAAAGGPSVKGRAHHTLTARDQNDREMMRGSMLSGT